MAGLAKLAGVSLSYIGNVENGDRPPTAEFLQKVCKALNVSREELLRDPDLGDRGNYDSRVRESHHAPDTAPSPPRVTIDTAAIAEKIRLATKLRSDARELRAIAERMESEAAALETSDF